MLMRPISLSIILFHILEVISTNSLKTQFNGTTDRDAVYSERVVTELRFYVQLDTKQVFLPANLLAKY